MYEEDRPGGMPRWSYDNHDRGKRWRIEYAIEQSSAADAQGGLVEPPSRRPAPPANTMASHWVIARHSIGERLVACALWEE